MDSRSEVLAAISSNLPPPALVAVSKTFPAERIREAYGLGIHDFGENRIQEFLQKREQLKDLAIRWHFVGRLQSNKIRLLVGKVHLFHALDSLKLFLKISEEGERVDVKTPSLIQVNVSQESQKGGILQRDLEDFCSQLQEHGSEYCPIRGLMCIGSSVEQVGEGQVRQEFDTMQSIFHKLVLMEKPYFKMEILSMGMSSDFRLAMKYGSNMIRVGRAIFGPRSG
jgi:PLP dependent protein